MPTVDQIEDKNGNVYDIEDATAREKIGELSDLKTTSKTNLVSALNETLTPSQIETITIDLGTLDFLRMGRLIKLEIAISCPEPPTNPIILLRNVDDKYLPLATTYTTIFNNDTDTPCGRVIFNSASKALDFFFAEDYQAVAGDSYVCDLLYIAKC